MTRRQKLVRTALLVPLLLAAAGVVFAFARDDHAAAPHGIVPPPPEVSVARVLSKEVSPWDEFTGRVSAVETVELRPRVSGYIERVAYEEGAEIHKGDRCSSSTSAATAPRSTVPPRTSSARAARRD